ncbi:hypothetical protein COW36_03050 [bacterium (Candidatus Blackallbacteria) CG17_big_fil_post_rev_8_21_14_2_50_48_46]|uniref:Uncharacterized protein n=1 Tax=bacterium (Candidatus Blackallbacteria) CG17_big_fil_post_rev_8_21_14_2_50_48_46 TaxID=2014261 RepID=A0A2M7GAI4_9BACT|nr:MAG: hypothetical protein COW64_12425 [bacterium (Candidatus Blackallbacteria) CG18_big_fil_WC_8_21_14_2_50_49_26]PIW19104.1 MAG: hypothetical protein COW36_03050 [bacterium (Candidatus Blackallbacteria) CG17_big_fil_post_rev_8_21_14_2_50_48_46]PIW44529.1 MAG: hypothetical protein COW20_23070 [bacterium (Candidatus Blackallbacteria) CG13_big_fil_rev_8_21_14_2_50_49_14]
MEIIPEYDFLNRYSWFSQDLADILLNWLLTKVQPDQRTILVIDELYPLWVHQVKPYGQMKTVEMASFEGLLRGHS